MKVPQCCLACSIFLWVLVMNCRKMESCLENYSQKFIITSCFLPHTAGALWKKILKIWGREGLKMEAKGGATLQKCIFYHWKTFPHSSDPSSSMLSIPQRKFWKLVYNALYLSVGRCVVRAILKLRLLPVLTVQNGEFVGVSTRLEAAYLKIIITLWVECRSRFSNYNAGSRT